jgi:hypothetical protein
MPRTSAADAPHSDDRSPRDPLPGSPPSDPDAALDDVRPAAAPLIDDAAALRHTAVARPRLCVLCGRPLRAGQHMLRVHGSTIHARCSHS